MRYGGEESCVLLVDVGADAAAATADRRRDLPDHAADEQGLIAAADAALYRAKHAGRNRVELARAPA